MKAARFDLRITELENAAFDTFPQAELARILREAADKIENGHQEFTLRDLNGNRVGAAEFS